MIKLIETVKDYVDEKYFDFITDREFNGKDPNYFGKVSDEIAEEVYNFLSELIEDDVVVEKWTSENNLKVHFHRHCIGTDSKKSIRRDIRYDFKYVDEYKEYSDIINSDVLTPDYKIISLYNTVDVFSALTEITTQPISILFDVPCDLETSHGVVKLALHSFANDVTTNYSSVDTINIMVLSKDNETISLYAIDSKFVESKFRNIINKYSGNKKIRKLYKK